MDLNLVDKHATIINEQPLRPERDASPDTAGVIVFGRYLQPGRGGGAIILSFGVTFWTSLRHIYWDFHMNTRLRHMIIVFILLTGILPSARVLAGPSSRSLLQEETPTSLPEETATESPAIPSPAEIIDAVNNLRIFNGLNALAVDSVLMDVAVQQANALAATGGAVGHQRPCGMTLGQDLLLRGFALWGDLSQDGYRSENWGTASSAEEIVAAWLGDDLHANTMLSPHRSHLGAAVAVSDQIYIVLETALQTNSGQMQHTAYDILTGIPATRAACIGLSTQHAEYGNLSQYSIPVAMSTARPDGDVIHEVKYGQSLWSIAIQYSTTIEQIKRLNNLTSDTIVPGWALLIQKAATQPAPPTTSLSAFAPLKQDLRTPTPGLTSIPSQTEIAPSLHAGQFIRENSIVVVAFLLSFSVLVAALVGFGKKKI